MAGKDPGGSNGLISDINITPFVDIILVLLIIFMISAPVVVQSSLGLKLPEAASSINKDRITLHIFLMANGELRAAGKPIKKEQLGSLLEKVKKSDPQFDVVVSADRNLSHGKVLEVIDMIRVLGATEVGIGVESRKF